MRRGDDSSFADPLLDDSAWERVRLPRKFDLKKNREHRTGIVWFRRRVSLPRRPVGDLLLQIREIMNADEVFINGRLVGSSGSFPPRFRSAWAKFRSYKIPRDYFRQGENLIAIRMYYNAEAWISGPMVLTTRLDGAPRRLWYDFVLNHLLHGFTFLLMFIGFFFIIFFLKRRAEVAYLYFALGAISAAAAISLQFFENFYGALPISSNGILRFTQVGLLFMPLWISLFFQHYMYDKVGRVRFFLSLSLPVAGSICMLFASTRWEILFWRNNFLIGFFLLFGDLLLHSVLQLIRGNRGSVMMVAGLLPVLLLGAHDIMAFALNWLDSTVALFIYGFPLLLIILSAHLTNRFVNSLNKTEELNDTLNKMVDSITRFVPSQFISHLRKENITDVALGDSLLNTMTVLFSDIRNFTRISEDMTPQDNFRFLNAYLKRMEPSIDRNDGFVDKFIGDAIMALFAGSGDSALTAAISMRLELRKFNEDRIAAGYSGIDFGIGLNSGDVMLGTVGSVNRMDTTVIGTTVNLAARLEKLTKVYRAPIIISEFVYASLAEPKRFDIRELDLVRVKGMEQAVRIYEVFDSDEDELRTWKKESLDEFHSALDLYRRGLFDQARDIFRIISDSNTSDHTVRLYEQRCGKLLQSPPGSGWAGVGRLRN